MAVLGSRLPAKGAQVHGSAISAQRKVHLVKPRHGS